MVAVATGLTLRKGAPPPHNNHWPELEFAALTESHRNNWYAAYTGVGSGIPVTAYSLTCGFATRNSLQ
jgi:hypothetical protein